MSTVQTIRGIDPYAPGGIDALLAFHKSVFGNARMEEGDGDAQNDSDDDDKPTETPTIEQLQESIAKLSKSLEASRNDTKAAKAEAARVKELEGKLEAADAEKMTEQEKAVAAARKEAATEVTGKVASRLISERVRSLAAGKFSEPGDALMFLKESGALKDISVSDDLEIDDEPITKALNELGEKRPHWLAGSAEGTAKRAGIGGQGSGGGKRAGNLSDAIAAKYTHDPKKPVKR